MTRADVINNLFHTYSKHGVTKDNIKKEIESGLAEGFTCSTIYTGLRMAFGSVYKEDELFTAAELAEAFDMPVDEVNKQIEGMIRHMELTGQDTTEYVKTAVPQRFIIPPGGLR